MTRKQLLRALVPLVGCASLLLVAGGRANAQTAVFSLANLLAGTSGTDGLGNIQIDDKLFQFAGGLGSYSTIGPDMPTAANVNVQGVFIAGNPGLSFTGFWHANPGNGNEQAFIQYHVLVTNPNKYIIAAHLDGDPIVNGGNGQASVTESISTHLTHASVLAPPLSIFDIATNGGATHTTDLNDQRATTGTVAELQYLHVQKTINASADSPTSTAQITHIEQTFVQDISAPEPASVALLAGMGIPACVGLIRRRRRAA